MMQALGYLIEVEGSLSQNHCGFKNETNQRFISPSKMFSIQMQKMRHFLLQIGRTQAYQKGH